MNKILSNICGSSLKFWYSAPGIFRVLSYSTLRLSSSSSSLYGRLHDGFEFDPKASIIPVLDKWVFEGHKIHHDELRKIVKDFRGRRRFRCALEIVEWMSDTKHFEIKPGYVALRLELISKVHGVEQAEHYFHGLDDSLKVLPVYGSLLCCYANAKSLEKAEAIMENIRKSKLQSTISYNLMLRLYHQMGMHEKLDSLTQEMEDKNLAYDEFSYNILLNAYGTSSIEKMEKLLMKMEVDPLVNVNYHIYVAVTKGYIKAGDRTKALASLKKAEHLIPTGKERRQGFIVLLTVYASMQKTDEVFRLWNLLQKIGKLRNKEYLCMINALARLDNLDEAKKVLAEWEEQHISFDIRIPKQVIHAFCKRGQMTEAEAIIKRLIETGNEPSARTWSRMSLGYYQNNLMEKVVEATKKSFAVSFPGWKPDLSVVAACLEYLKTKGDLDGAEEILQLLASDGHFSSDYKKILQRYIYNDETRPETVELDTS